MNSLFGGEGGNRYRHRGSCEPERVQGSRPCLSHRRCPWRSGYGKHYFKQQRGRAPHAADSTRLAGVRASWSTMCHRHAHRTAGGGRRSGALLGTFASTVFDVLDTAPIRIPTLILGTVGAMANLYSVWHARQIRKSAAVESAFDDHHPRASQSPHRDCACRVDARGYFL